MALPSCWDVTVETAERVWGCRTGRRVVVGLMRPK